MGDESEEVDAGVIATVKAAIGKDADLELVKKLKIEHKGERVENRILALSTNRLYILVPSKSGGKIDQSIHLLEIQAIESNKPLQVTIICNDKSYSFRVQKAKESVEVIAQILASLKSTFPAGNPDRLLKITFGPPEQAEERQKEVTTLVKNLRNAETDAEVGPCGGFSKVYESLCDYYGSRFLEEVAWDVDTIYLSHNTKEFNLQDFDHLEQKDLVPIISALEYNDWFTKLICVSYKLSSDVLDAIIRVVKKSTSLEELVLNGVSLGKEYSQKLALAVTSNAKTALHSLDLSNNSLEDRGVTHIAGTFSKLTHGLVSFSLADTGMTSRSCMLVGQSLKSSKYIGSSLKRLNFSKNPLKVEGISSLADFLAQPNSLTHLDLSSTECSLDLVFGALLRGCIQNLTHLNLSGNTFTSKKGKEVTVPPSFQKFFSSTASLKSLDVSDCRIPPEAVGAILTGLSENSLASNVELNLSRNELRSGGAVAIAEGIVKVKNVKLLDISDNGFETDLIKIVDALGRNESVTRLYIGQNISKGRHVANIMEAIVKLISEENSTITFLSLADSKLKHEIILLLDALGTNETLIELDLSGNYMGDEGARILAKALQLNTKLRTLHWDRNGTTHRGFGDIAAALESNHTLHSMPTPLHDATQWLKLKPQTEQHLRQIERLLLRNQSPSKIVTEQAYRLQQALLVSSTQQQAVDRQIVYLQDTMLSLRTSKDEEVKKQVALTKQCIQDADKLKQLLLKFYLCTNDAPLEERFSQLTADFYLAAQESMTGNIDKIMECAREECPYITSQEDVKASLQQFDEGKARLSRTFVEEVILTQAAAAVLNRVSEDKLTVASIVADTLMDIVIRHLETSSIKLDLLLKEHRSKVALGEEDGGVFDNESDAAVAARKAKNRLSSATRISLPSDSEDRGAKPVSNRRRPTVTHRPHKEAAIANGVPEVKENEKEEEEKPQLEVKLAAEPKSVEVKLELPQSQKPEIKVSTSDLDFGSVEQGNSGNLTHLVKYRARPARGRRLPTRPSNRPTENGTSNDTEEDESNIERFWSQAPEVELKVNVTPATETKKTPSKSSPSAVHKGSPKSTKDRAPAPGKTPPKPAPKPRPANSSSKSQDSKKAGWMPKGGISLGFSGIFKKKNRDRSHSGGHADEDHKKASWYANEEDKSQDEETKEEKKEKKVEKKEEKKEEKKAEQPRPRLTSASRPLPILRPVAAPRERTGTDPMNTAKIPVPQTRERTQSATPAVEPTASAAKTNVEQEEKKEEEKKAPIRGPPKFGVGMGMGIAGGGLLAEMKLRQEKGASVGKKLTPEKKTEESVQDKPAPKEPSSDSPVVNKEPLVRPSSLKRNRLPSDTPPKPQPKPVIGKKPAVLAPKPAQKPKKEEEAKPEEKIEKNQETKEETKKEKEEKSEEKVNVTKEEEKKEEKTEEKGKHKNDEPDGDKNKVEKETVQKPETGKEEDQDQEQKDEDELPWVRREIPPSPRPLERSKSYDVQPVSPVEITQTGRSATLPRPWAPAQPVTSSLLRKTSLEMPPEDEKPEEEAKEEEEEERKRDEEKEKERKKEEEQEKERRKEEEQEKERKKEEEQEKERRKEEEHEKERRKEEEQKDDGKQEAVREDSSESGKQETTKDEDIDNLEKLPEKPTTKLEPESATQNATSKTDEKEPEIQGEEKSSAESPKEEQTTELATHGKEDTTPDVATNDNTDKTKNIAEMVDLLTETHL